MLGSILQQILNKTVPIATYTAYHTPETAQKIAQGLAKPEWYGTVKDLIGNKYIENPLLLKTSSENFGYVPGQIPQLPTSDLMSMANPVLGVINLGATVGLYFFIHHKFKQMEKIMVENFTEIKDGIYVIHHKLDDIGNKLIKIEAKVDAIIRGEFYSAIEDLGGIPYINNELVKLRKIEDIRNRLSSSRKKLKFNMLSVLSSEYIDEFMTLLVLWSCSSIPIVRCDIDSGEIKLAIETVKNYIREYEEFSFDLDRRLFQENIEPIVKKHKFFAIMPETKRLLESYRNELTWVNSAGIEFKEWESAIEQHRIKSGTENALYIIEPAMIPAVVKSVK